MDTDFTFRAVACLKNRDEMKKFEDKEDCFILDFDPNQEEFNNTFSNLSVSHTLEPELLVVAEKGKVACRDYPHSRHACAKFPFRSMPHEIHCEMCYCYVCDYAAPCKKWVGKARHCDAYDNEKWSIKRKLWREAVERKKEAYRGCPHPRYMCMEFPYRSTPHNSHCQLCFCYVCESAAPCGEWAGTSGHCHAFNNENWRTKRELKRYPTQGKSAYKVQDQGTVTDERPEEAKLYVQNLSDTVTAHDLEMFFKRAGVVKKSEVISVKSTRKSREIGFVTMSTVEDAEKAVAMFDGHLLHGMLLTVERCVPRLPRPISAETYSIYVGNLTRSVDDKRLEEIFRKRGYKIMEALVAVDRVTKMSYGYGFVKMCRESEREDAIKNLDGQMVNGKAIKLVRAPN